MTMVREGPVGWEGGGIFRGNLLLSGERVGGGDFSKSGTVGEETASIQIARPGGRRGA